MTTNAVITKSWAAIGLITTQGFRDVLALRRHDREELYHLMWDPPPPLVPRGMRLEVGERVDYAGTVVSDLDDAEVAPVVDRLRDEGVESLAVCSLHSYANPAHELRVGQVVRERRPEAYVPLSSDLLREPQEFDRTSMTAVSALRRPGARALSRRPARSYGGRRVRGRATTSVSSCASSPKDASWRSCRDSAGRRSIPAGVPDGDGRVGAFDRVQRPARRRHHRGCQHDGVQTVAGQARVRLRRVLVAGEQADVDEREVIRRQLGARAQPAGRLSRKSGGSCSSYSGKSEDTCATRGRPCTGIIERAGRSWDGERTRWAARPAPSRRPCRSARAAAEQHAVRARSCRAAPRRSAGRRAR